MQPMRRMPRRRMMMVAKAKAPPQRQPHIQQARRTPRRRVLVAQRTAPSQAQPPMQRARRTPRRRAMIAATRMPPPQAQPPMQHERRTPKTHPCLSRPRPRRREEAAARRAKGPASRVAMWQAPWPLRIRLHRVRTTSARRCRRQLHLLWMGLRNTASWALRPAPPPPRVHRHRSLTDRLCQPQLVYRLLRQRLTHLVCMSIQILALLNLALQVFGPRTRPRRMTPIRSPPRLPVRLRMRALWASLGLMWWRHRPWP
mmetsp:Transcript_16793/g.54194  ORF Transcript_16793/g.54194 Transcript_16793/m.54194 type:complete len:257 (-) Transcript_16793:1222-1992(-)